jgi:serine/threonine protein phosphatase 1
MKKLPVYIEYPEEKSEDGRYLVVSHSILHNVWKLKDTTEEYKKKQFRKTAMWSRDFHVVDNPDIYNVIGHTPQEYDPKITKIYSNVDTGCCFKEIPSRLDFCPYGTLTALKFPEMDIITQENIDKY